MPDSSNVSVHTVGFQVGYKGRLLKRSRLRLRNSHPYLHTLPENPPCEQKQQ